MQVTIREPDTAVEIALLRSELHTTNGNMSRIADAVEKALGDHETRLRVVEAANQRTAGVLKLISFIGVVPTAGLVLVLAKHWT